ncbi:MAG: GNAT family N-acetyltransferase [Deltaproteobacteria bacterium]|nr:GNAT family N-acetyltransferase [Deltaproteobacteria bacterium]
MAPHVSVAVRAATASIAGRQASWIATLEPWLGLGYSPVSLRRFLRRAADSGQVWVAWGANSPASRDPLGLLVVQPGVLLGDFVALLAVRSEAAGQGIGRALMGHAESKTFVDRRWLFVSADSANRAALGFYRKLGFLRVGRLPDLVRVGRTEILLRKGQSTTRG